VLIFSKYFVLAMMQLYSFDFAGMSAGEADSIKNNWAVRFSIESKFGELNLKTFDPFPNKSGVSGQVYNKKLKLGSRLSFSYDDPFYGEGAITFEQGYLFYHYSLAGKGELRLGILPTPVYANPFMPFVFQSRGLDFRGLTFIAQNISGEDIYYDGYTDFVPRSGEGIGFVHKFEFPLVMEAGYLLKQSVLYVRSDFSIRTGKMLFRPEVLYFSFNPGVVEFTKNELFASTSANEILEKQTGSMSITRFKLSVLTGKFGFDLVFGLFDFKQGELSVYEGFDGLWTGLSVFYLLDFSRKSFIQYMVVRNDLSIRNNGDEKGSSTTDSLSLKAGFLKAFEIDLAFSIRSPHYDLYKTKSYLYIGLRFNHNLGF